MDARGASGRLIVGPVNLKREDLDFNYLVVGRAIEWVGCRPSIEPLADAAGDFFHKTRVKGRPPSITYPSCMICTDDQYFKNRSAYIVAEVISAKLLHGVCGTLSRFSVRLSNVPTDLGNGTS